MRKMRIKRNILAFFALTSMLISLMSAILPSLTTQKVAADSNVATWVLCGTEDGKLIYNAATTDLVPYSLRSKSNLAKTERIDGILNSILGVSGFKFKEVNEAILGRSLRDESVVGDKDSSDTTDKEKKKKENANSKAKKVNPFDRFGVAGLKWSSYAGEWKYYETDGCADQDEASKTDFGVFYTDRKEPKASFNETPQSKDPRVIQYNKGLFASWSNSFNGMLTNAIFSITKVIVTMTIALIGFSFTDVTELIGLGTNNGGGGLVGLFNNLYSGFFSPLLYSAFALTTVYVIYYGLIKRQIRKSLINGFGQTLACMFVAAVIAGNASFWIPLPNKIATYGQAVIITAMGQSTTGKNGLCGTNVGAMTLNSSSVNLNASDSTKKDQMKKISANMKSTIGCRMWEEFLFKPWVRGQFGTEYENLVVGGAKGSKLKNTNYKWTKKADVPLGGNTIVNNLALFQLSAQTEAHAQISGETGTVTDSSTNKIQLVDGVSSDWWRVVDILSNYDEKEVKTTPTGGEGEVTTIVQTNKTALPQWQSWIGNNQSERYSTALLSVLFGGIGSLGPLVFGMLTTVYSVGVTLLMALSPIFLLFGCWAGRGQIIFKGWLESLLSTMLKKIATSALLLISFSFTISSMNMIDKVGWLKSFVLLFIVTIVLLKNRKRIMDLMTRVNLGGMTNPTTIFEKVVNKKTDQAKDTGLLAMSVAVGAYQGHRVGMSLREGASLGAGVQLTNTLRKSEFGRNAMMTHNQVAGKTDMICSICGNSIHSYAYNDTDGNTYCGNCAKDLGLETELYKIEVKNGSYYNSSAYVKRMKKIRKQRLITRGPSDENLTLQEQREQRAELKKVLANQDKKQVHNSKQKGSITDNKSWLSYTKAQQLIQLKRDEQNNLYWNNSEVLSMIQKNFVNLDIDIEKYEEVWISRGESATPPALPEPIQKYLSNTVVDEAWHAGRYDEIKDMYREGWSQWYMDNSLSINTMEKEQKIHSLELIDKIGTDEEPQSFTIANKPLVNNPQEPLDKNNSEHSEQSVTREIKRNPDNIVHHEDTKEKDLVGHEINEHETPVTSKLIDRENLKANESSSSKIDNERDKGTETKGSSINKNIKSEMDKNSLGKDNEVSFDSIKEKRHNKVDEVEQVVKPSSNKKSINTMNEKLGEDANYDNESIESDEGLDYRNNQSPIEKLLRDNELDDDNFPPLDDEETSNEDKDNK